MKKTKKEVLERRKKLLTILKFILIFNLLSIPMYVVMYLNLSFPQLQSFLTNSVYQTLKFLNYPITQEGDTLWMTFFSSDKIVYKKVEMTLDCTGWKPTYALAALTISTPSDNKKKLRFLAIGLPLVFFLNFIRILTTLIFSFHFGYQYLEIVHNLLWREGLILAVVMIWYVWLRKENIIR